MKGVDIISKMDDVRSGLWVLEDNGEMGIGNVV